jgi:hypothetical protein
MKQILVLVSFVFFCNIWVLAQNKLSKADFEQLVDYANCKYVQAFIEKNDVGNTSFSKIYKTKVKTLLNKVSLNNFSTVLNFTKLEELLSYDTVVLDLAKKINSKKLTYNDSKNADSLILLLKVKSWNRVDLSGTSLKIQNELMTKYNLTPVKKNGNEPEKKTDNKQTNVTPIQVNTNLTNQELKENLDKPIKASSEFKILQTRFDSLQQLYLELRYKEIIQISKSIDSFRIILFSALGLLILIITAILFLFTKLFLRAFIIKQVLESTRIDEKFNTKNNNQYSNITKSYSLTEKDINTIVDRVLESERLRANESIQQNKTTTIEKPESPRTTLKYLKGKSGKIFSRVDNTPENSFFRIFNESEDNALFEFSGNEAEAIAKRIFSEDICNIVSGSYQNAHSVKTNKPGKIKRLGDQWEVTETIEINLI